ncbi:MAG: hypothetical protein ACD_23C01023G0003 [uncultured bacterium]|nr:MAG: hypothetical protein ACD_23C01023G0003 [uncultured bacterium]
MPATSQFKTTNQEITSFIEFKTGRIPELSRDAPGDLVTIKSPSTLDVAQAAIKFAAGCPESKLLGSKSS